MSILQRAIGAPAPSSADAATARQLAAALGRAEPDPLFRRRLRGELMNRYVAEREGLLRRSPARREMGRLGRAVLYASLGLALSVTAVGAAADQALPGDLLYVVKLQLEDVRMRVAPPSFRDDLAKLAVAERVAEVERLAAAGSWKLVPAAAARVTAAEVALVAIDPAAGGAAASKAVVTLESILADAPPQAQGGLERALENVESAARPPAKPPAAPAATPPAERPTPRAVKDARNVPPKPPPAAARPTAAPDEPVSAEPEPDPKNRTDGPVGPSRRER